MRGLSVLIYLLVLSFTSHSQVKKPKAKIEYVKQYNYRIELVTNYGYTGYQRHYIIDNSQINSNLSYNEHPCLLKPLTLYSITSDKSKPKPDTAYVSLTKNDCDSLFNLTRSFFRSFNFNNVDTVTNGVSGRTRDFGHWSGEVSIEFEGRVLTAKIKDIENASVSTVEFQRLRKYISKFDPMQKE